MLDSLYTCFNNGEEKERVQVELYKLIRRQAISTKRLCEDIINACDIQFDNIDDAFVSIREMYQAAKNILSIIENDCDLDITIGHFCDPVPITNVWVTDATSSIQMNILDEDLQFLGLE